MTVSIDQPQIDLLTKDDKDTIKEDQLETIHGGAGPHDTMPNLHEHPAITSTASTGSSGQVSNLERENAKIKLKNVALFTAGSITASAIGTTALQALGNHY